MNRIRNIPINDIVYAAPVVLWLVSFGLTRLAPLSALRVLCVRLNLCPSVPAVAPADMDLPENVEAIAAAMRAAAEAAGTDATDEDIWHSATGTQRRRYLRALLSHPLNVCCYWWDILAVDDAGRGRGLVPGGRAVVAVLRSFTALCVHANRVSLISAIFSYLHILSVGKQCVFRCEAAADLAGAVAGAMLANLWLLLSARAISRDGLRVPLRATIVADRPVLRWLKYVLLPGLRTVLLLLQPNGLSVRFTRSSNSSSSNSNIHYGDDGIDLDDGAAAAATEAAAPRDSDGGYSPATWARAAGAVEVVVPRLGGSARQWAYVCGGEGFAYALAGFRLVYRSDVAQLRGAAWSYWIDSFQTYVNYWVQQGATPGGGGDSSSSSSQNPFTVVDAATGDVFFHAASSEELNQQNIVAFLAGCAVGFAGLHAPRVVKVVRRVPVLSSIVNFLSPPPLPAIDIPDGLMGATITDLAVVRLRYHHHHHGPRRWQQQQQVLRTDPPTAATANAYDHPHHRRAESTSSSNSSSNNSSVFIEYAASAPADGAGREGEDRAEDGGEEYVDLPVPPQCFCPITRCIMADPVTTVDGFTYEREAITAWLQHRPTSPMTNLPLSDAKLVTNTEVYAIVKELVRKYNAFVELHRHQPTSSPSPSPSSSLSS